MPRVVTSGNAIAVGEPFLASRIHQHRAERFVACVERLAGELNATAQETTIAVAEHR